MTSLDYFLWEYVYKIKERIVYIEKTFEEAAKGNQCLRKPFQKNKLYLHLKVMNIYNNIRNKKYNWLLQTLQIIFMTF